MKFMSKYSDTPIFQKTYMLTINIYKMVSNFKKEHKYTLGEKLKNISHPGRAKRRSGISFNNNNMDYQLKYLRKEIPGSLIPLSFHQSPRMTKRHEKRT